MNKQILIDDVDVSGCEHVCITKPLFSEKAYIQCSAFFLENEDSYCDCTDNPNCNYKNWKRKEQECDELNKWLPIVTRLESAFGNIETEKVKSIACKTYAEQVFTELDQLKEENEELEKELRQKKATILMNNDHYFEVDKTNRKLKQALTEIKNIAVCITSTFYKGVEISTTYEQLKQILQKCEVLDE